MPTLVIYDKGNVDVHYSAAHKIVDNLDNGWLLITEQLGHRKVFGTQK
jgi:hypothetical protein